MKVSQSLVILTRRNSTHIRNTSSSCNRRRSSNLLLLSSTHIMRALTAGSSRPMIRLDRPECDTTKTRYLAFRLVHDCPRQICLVVILGMVRGDLREKAMVIHQVNRPAGESNSQSTNRHVKAIDEAYLCDKIGAELSTTTTSESRSQPQHTTAETIEFMYDYQ